VPIARSNGEPEIINGGGAVSYQKKTPSATKTIIQAVLKEVHTSSPPAAGSSLARSNAEPEIINGGEAVSSQKTPPSAPDTIEPNIKIGEGQKKRKHHEKTTKSVDVPGPPVQSYEGMACQRHAVLLQDLKQLDSRRDIQYLFRNNNEDDVGFLHLQKCGGGCGWPMVGMDVGNCMMYYCMECEKAARLVDHPLAFQPFFLCAPCQTAKLPDSRSGSNNGRRGKRHSRKKVVDDTSL
jgi:hypothetical protein